jgi:Family of unknown function (DUF6445)
MEKIIYPRFLIVKDNFYDQPHKVYEKALQATYYEPEHVTGYRTTKVYHEKGVKAKLEKILSIKIIRWDTDPLEENGVFYQGFSKGKKKEVPGVHSDEPFNDVTIVIYLTPGLPLNCGTSLWMHKMTGLIDPVTPADARRLKMNFTKLRDQLEKESKDRSKWIEIDRVGYRFNRMLAYPSGAFHSATNHYGGSLEGGRIYQTFRVGVEWDTFKMKQADLIK